MTSNSADPLVYSIKEAMRLSTFGKTREPNVRNRVVRGPAAFGERNAA